MAERFLHASFSFNEPLSDQRKEALKEIFNRSLDWMDYAGNCWIIYTRQSPDVWYVRLREFMKSGEFMFIVEFDPKTAQGMLRAWMWRWLNFDRTETKTVGDGVVPDETQAILPGLPSGWPLVQEQSDPEEH